MRAQAGVGAAGPGQARGTGNRARLDRSIREFEGLLWNQVLQQMSRVRLGPDMLGSGGRTWQRMFLYRLSERYGGRVESSLTRALRRQLGAGPPAGGSGARGPSYAEVAGSRGRPLPRAPLNNSAPGRIPEQTGRLSGGSET
ncbi:MAG TPA: hypothetical protein VFA95_15490 [Gammaproteobacteria bacterium]|nr:hypothetical protein [Gammaproteobacteria bacterium]